MKVLWYSDFLCGSGFARVAHELVKRLHATGDYEFHVLGINYFGEPANHPASAYRAFREIPVHPAAYYRNDPRGEQRLLELLAAERFDVLFVMVNPWDLARLGPRLRALKAARGFRFIYYFPIEQGCDPVWIEEAIGLADRPVAYTHMGAEAVKRAGRSDCDVIYHGVDAKVFTPYEGHAREIYRLSAWDAKPEEVVLVNVNRNQARKDLPRSMLVARSLAEHLDRPVLLYLHADAKDVAGADLLEFERRWLKGSKARVICGRGQRTLSDAQLSRIYGCGDVLLSTALCEGWGLSTIEAFAAELPVVVPNCSVFPELIGYHGHRGKLADLDGYTMLPGQSELFSLTDVHSMVKHLADTLADPDEAHAQAFRAKEWVLEHCDWGRIAQQWDAIFASCA